MRRQFLTGLLSLLFVCGGFIETATAQDAEATYSFDGSTAFVSKYIWRGQRLTNDWSLQPSATLNAKGFSFNAWGTMDLAAVNKGDSLPLGGSGADGLKGKFSEIDYTLSYEHSFSKATVGAGTILYTFPERSATLHSTTEIYGKVGFDSVPLAPSVTLYVDVDETKAITSGSNGVYFLVSAGHSLGFSNPVFTGLDLSGTFSFVNSGFTNYYYSGLKDGGPHDASFTVGLPIKISDSWSASPFVTYSGLIGKNIRNSQYQDLRVATKPTGAAYADTVWGGFSLSLSF